jgi:hypothetical protein
MPVVAAISTAMEMKNPGMEAPPVCFYGFAIIPQFWT